MRGPAMRCDGSPSSFPSERPWALPMALRRRFSLDEWRVSPVLIVRDVASSLAYYRDFLLFQVVGVLGDPPEMAFVGRQGIQIMLQDAEGRAVPGPNQRSKSVAWDVLVWVRDVRALHAELVERGAKIRKAPYVTFYGHTEIEVLDPDDHVICFSEPPA